MPGRKRPRDWSGPAAERHCEVPGCTADGRHRAPYSRDELGRFHWFCLAHAREYNLAWNFFEGMSQTDIERFQREDVTGHRPTWPMAAGAAHRWHLHGPFPSDSQAFDDRERSAADAVVAGRRPEERRALARLNLGPRSTLAEIKRRYKKLVKRYHPDLNGGDKRGEERLKDLNEAYRTLMTCGG